MCFLIAHEHILKNEHDELMLTGVSCDHVSAYVPRKQDRQLTSDGGYKGRRGGGERQEMNGGGTGGSGVSLLM